MPSVRLLVWTLLVLTPVLDAVDQPKITRANRIPLRVVGISEPAELRASELWVTTDGGEQWVMKERRAMAEDASELPVFTFQPPADGRYGFALVNEMRDGRHAQRPAPGTPPKDGYVVIFDRAPPVIETFSVRGLDARLQTVEWATRDPNPAAAGARFQIAPLEVDDPDWIDFGEPRPASGSWSVALPTGTHTLRLVVVDRAGNRRISDPWRAPAPPPEIETPVAEAAPPAPAGEPEPATESGTRSATEPVTEAKADTETPETTADPGTALSEAIAGLPDPDGDSTSTPAREPDPVQAEPSTTGEASPAAEPATPAPAPIPLTELAPLPPVVAASERVGLAGAPHPDQLPRGVLVGAAAERALRAARAAVVDDRIGDARELYRRLADSPLAATALAEEVLLLVHGARRIEAYALIHGAPPEARSPRLAWIQALLLLHDERFQEAEAAAASIPVDHELARRGLWLTALAFRGQGRHEAADQIFVHLARGGDLIAEYARRLAPSRTSTASGR